MVADDLAPGLTSRYGVGPVDLDAVEYAIDPCPVGLQPPTEANRLAVRYTPYNGPGAMPT